MFHAGYIYQAEHPVNFCIRCETAIAFAEVTYQERETTLTTFDFDGVEIATTRPELLAACVAVAVHPDDERFTRLQGQELTVPFFGQRVPVLRDPAVDPTFGTGVVMICTFGDKQDVHWWKEYGLPLRKAIDRKGTMTGIAGKYAGMRVGDARSAIVADMKGANLLRGEKRITQRVGTCWRCKTPIEILSERQWFIRVKHEEILEGGPRGDLDPGAHAHPARELGRPDGVGLVHLPAADLRNPHPGLVLRRMRRDDPPVRGRPARRPHHRPAEGPLPEVWRDEVHPRGGRPRYLDGLLHLGPQCHRLGREQDTTPLPRPAQATGA